MKKQKKKHKEPKLMPFLAEIARENEAARTAGPAGERRPVSAVALAATTRRAQRKP